MEKGQFISWDDGYLLGISLIDEQHRNLFRLTNGLHEACLLGRDATPEGFRRAVTSTVNYVSVHFNAEEKLMAKAGYPAMAEHVAEHRAFVAKMLAEIGLFEDGKPEVAERFVLFLKNWILSHIAMVDKKMAEHVRGSPDVRWGERKEEKGVFISWDGAYSVGIPLIDAHHRELIRLANELYDTCREGSSSAKSGFRAAAGTVAAYVKRHFSSEEKIMARVGYPLIEEHKAEHRIFVDRFLSEVRDFQEGKPFVANAFTGFLKSWVLSHIARSDKKLGSYILDMAKSGAFAHGTEKGEGHPG
ncbi:MAG: bacteriohemerythrin [Treponema sp.]|nr:bacteriohemerythrin [Treponema sp.]